MKVTKKLYQEVHKWLYKNYGNAHKCENKNCKNNSKHYQWSLIKGKTYDFVRSHFQMLCAKCHFQYDGPHGFVLGHKYNNGKKFSEEHKKRIGISLSKAHKLNPQIGKLNHFYGKKHSEETKRKISETKRKQYALSKV